MSIFEIAWSVLKSDVNKAWYDSTDGGDTDGLNDFHEEMDAEELDAENRPQSDAEQELLEYYQQKYSHDDPELHDLLQEHAQTMFEEHVKQHRSQTQSNLDGEISGEEDIDADAQNPTQKVEKMFIKVV
tara:strand:- start:1750 stop:2136 length:387 start_codon:yes stop_codon:yes gene_type:complete